MRAACTRAALAAALLMATGAALASEALADKHACLNCHLIEKKLVGPSFKDVAKKYRGLAGAAEVLRNKVSNGGSGVWGAVPMPAMTAVPPDDTQALVAWILKL